MSSTKSSAVVPPTSVPAHPSLRLRGVALFVLLIAEVLLGTELANVGSPYPLGLLIAHVGLGLVLMGFSGHTLRLALQGSRAAVKGSAVLTALGATGAVISGFVFLFGDQAPVAELSMEGLGALALLGSLLLILVGGARASGSAPGGSS